MLKEKWDTQGYSYFLKDVEKLKKKIGYKKLRNKLSLKTNRMNYEALIQAIDSCTEDYVIVSDFSLLAKNEYERYKIYYEIEVSKLNDKARVSLEKMKQAKKISSQITIGMKREWIIKKFPKRFKRLEKTKRELKIIRDRLENLKEAWSKRMSLLQSQARAIESRRNIVIGGKTSGQDS